MAARELKIDRAIYLVDDESKTYRFLKRNTDYEQLSEDENNRNKTAIDGYIRIFRNGTRKLFIHSAAGRTGLGTTTIEFNVRAYRDEDLSDLKRLCRALDGYFQKLDIDSELKRFDSFSDTKRGIDHWIKTELAPGWYTLVAETQDGKLVGFIAGFTEEQPFYYIDKIGVIESFFVMARYRGHGIGKQLVKSLGAWFKKEDCKGMRVETWSGNPNAIEVYKQMDFKEFYIGLVREL